MKIGILGSTGSIGINSLEVIDNLIKQGYDIKLLFLTTNSNTDILLQQSKKYRPEFIFINTIDKTSNIKDSFSRLKIKILKNQREFLDFLETEVYDLIINAMVGISGLLPTISALKSGKNIALANKESMVVAGKLINELLSKSKSNLIPIDSEHSAILQCIRGEKPKSIKKIILTASGGPFRGKKKSELLNVTSSDALKHPNWKMGKKITIDSATMMNKGLEVIEARWLFDLDASRIETIIHHQSIIHSLVEFKDGSIKAQMGAPDMRIPIQYAITYPERLEGNYKSIDLSTINALNFEKPDFEIFRCLKLAYDSLNQGGTYPVVLNASNEIAVNLFLAGKIKFFDIPDLIENELNEHKPIYNYDVENILSIDSELRKKLLTKH